ncbi:MAG: DUF3732 domain-containing protein [Prevotella sp.]|nr:DUF3732 domain-containing protein [Prevotella sp.]
MNFYIKKIKLWFKTHSQPKEYTFEKNKVNVVTGDSSTGKSSILRVIDYCLLSRESAIVEDVINENVMWYGLAFHLNGHDYVVARKAPTNGRIGYDYYWAADTDEFPGDAFPKPTQGTSRAELQDFISREMHVPIVKLEEGRQTMTPTFREMMMLNYLTEDIIATSGTYFDTQLNTDVRLDPFVIKLLRLGLGTDEQKEQDYQAKIAELDKKIKSEETNKDRDIKNKEQYESKLKGIKVKALELGLIENDAITQEGLMALVKEKVDEFDRMKRSYRKLGELAALHDRKREIGKTLIDYRNLRREYKRAVEYSEKVKDSLLPMEYLKANLNTSLLGEEALALYQSLDEAFKHAKNSTERQGELPPYFEQNYQALKAEERDVNNKIEECNQIARAFFDPNMLMKYMALATDLKELKQKPEKYIGDVELNKLSDELERLKKDLELVHHENEVRAKKYLEDVQSYYEQQTGMSSSYRGCEVKFSEAWRRLELHRNGAYFPIKNVGSKSNYMFMHLCFYLGLHQYLSSQQDSIVPNFLFIDQPSIPYYGNNRRKTQQQAGDLKIPIKDDESKLKEAFRLINSFMSQNVGEDSGFQIILIEHADPEYWKDLDYFETRYVFTEDRDYGLIPEYVAPLT